MSKCLDRETLQAFLDREMATSDLVSAEIHFASCDKCRAEFEKLRAVNLHTQTLLDSLLPSQMPEIMPAAAIKFAPNFSTTRARYAAASIAALAACALLAFSIARHTSHPADPSSSVTSPNSVAVATQQAASIPLTPLEIVKPAPVATPNHVSHVAHKDSPHNPGPSKIDFIALDDDGPIESGTIVRMNLDASPKNSATSRGARKIPVDVLVDEQGEVRAIRFLNGGAK